MRPFEEDEAGIFFGRDKHTRQLLDKLKQSRFVAIIGPSGCGKSSLVNAGILASLRKDPKWRIAKCRPGNRPLTEFVRSLLQVSGLRLENLLTTDQKDAEGIPSFVDSIQKKKAQALSEIFDELCLTTFSNLLISIDQFEELFRYSQYSKTEEINGFISLLIELATQDEWPIYVLISVRSDYLGECIQFNGLLEAINNGQFITHHLNDDECKEAILRPALASHTKIEPALVDLLLTHARSSPHHFPLIQHSLMRVWKEISASSANNNEKILTVQAYKKIGGVENALSIHAEQVVSKLSKSAKKLTEFLFRALCEHGSGHKDPRRPVIFSELLSSLETIG